MLNRILTRLFASNRKPGDNPEQRMMAELQAADTKPAEPKSAAATADTLYAADIDAIEKRFGGPLRKGQTISISLHDALDLMPRRRRRSDAYKGLRSELKKRGIELVIEGGNKKQDR